MLEGIPVASRTAATGPVHPADLYPAPLARGTVARSASMWRGISTLGACLARLDPLDHPLIELGQASLGLFTSKGKTLTSQVARTPASSSDFSYRFIVDHKMLDRLKPARGYHP